MMAKSCICLLKDFHVCLDVLRPVGSISALADNSVAYIDATLKLHGPGTLWFATQHTNEKLEGIGPSMRN